MFGVPETKRLVDVVTALDLQEECKAYQSDPWVTAVKGYCSKISVTFWQNYCYLSNIWKLLLYCITAENFGSSKFAVTFSKFSMSAKKIFS